MKEKEIKVFVLHTDKRKIPQSEIFIPLHVNAIFSHEKNKESLVDCTGDNISDLYRYYGNLTGQYWVWKNLDKVGAPDYVGFMNYDRHFIFNEAYIPSNRDYKNLYGNSEIVFESLDDEYIESTGLNRHQIENIIRDNDIVITKRSDISLLGYNTVEEEFTSKVSDIYIFEKCMNTIQTLYPDYSKVVEKFRQGSMKYKNNMFIMKKDIFLTYASFLFSIIKEVEQQINFENLNGNVQYLLYSKLAEYILSIFTFKLYSENRKIKELYSSFVKDTFYEEDLKQAWKDNENAIAVSCSDLYTPYFSIYLKSIISNVSQKKKYDIIVLEDNISIENKQKLLDMINVDNISLRFYDVNFLFSKSKLPISLGYFSKHCYYRLAVGKIFKRYKKVVFTDIDIVLNFDLADLFDINMDGKVVAACEEVLWTKENRHGKYQLGKNIDDYINNKVKCTDIYYNTGVLIVDVEKFNASTNFDNLLKIAIEGQFINQEQCVLNQVLDSKFLTLDSIYNFEIFEGIYKSNLISYKRYMKYIKDAKIYHFLTDKKAWFYPELPKADIWWSYARQTPFYEEILARLIDFRISSKNPNISGGTSQLRQELAEMHFPNINKHFAKNEKEMKLLFVMDHPVKFKIKKWYFGFKKAFAFGQKHQKYQQKYDITKNLIKDAKRYKKSLFKV